ncbi:MAG: hypothetical protein ACQEW5_26985 [Bacillota bacterium]
MYKILLVEDDLKIAGLAKIKSVLRRVYGEYADISSFHQQVKEMEGLTANA